jgi:hypothetical protein
MTNDETEAENAMWGRLLAANVALCSLAVVTAWAASADSGGVGSSDGYSAYAGKEKDIIHGSECKHHG